MTKPFIAVVVAATIAVTSSFAAPAKAGNEDVAKFLAGAATLFIIGKAIERSNRSGASVEVSKNTHKKRHGPKKSQQPKRHHQQKSDSFKKLPTECRFKIPSRRGERRAVYGKHCLNDNMRQAHRLPGVCEETVKIRHGRRSRVFDAHCLQDFGFQGERRSRR